MPRTPSGAVDDPTDLRAELTLSLFEGLSEPAKEFLLHMLLYKSVFVGDSFRMLLRRESSPELRTRLMRISHGSAKEAAALSTLVREWDGHPGVWDHVSVATKETRAQLLRDLIRLKEGMTEAGLFAALRAPSESLRDRFLKIVDEDRRDADDLREFLGKTTTVAFREAEEHGLGAHDARDRRASLSGAVRARLAQFEAKGARGLRLVVSGDGLRHLRDEHVISEDGRCFGLPIDIDLGWEGDVYAIVTDERLTYAELVVAMRTSAE